MIDWNKEKDKLQQLLDEGNNFSQIAKIYGIKKGHTIKYHMIQLGIKIIDPKTGLYYEPKFNEFKCKYCGQLFESAQKLGGHSIYCKKNPNRQHNLDMLSKNRNKSKDKNSIQKKYICQFCGKETGNAGAATLHEKYCKLNPNKVEYIRKDPKKYSHTAWNKGKTKLTDERIQKYSNTKKENIKNGIIIPKGYPHTEKTKQHLREKMIEYIKKTGNGEFGQHFSLNACDYIDYLNEKNGWNLIHAKNGGEKQVCGYFLDGYDEKLNIAFEYDEPKHYKDVYNNILKERDIVRQNQIIKELNCQFYRYNEKLNLLYKVN